jgi:hypothetical protein
MQWSGTRPVLLTAKPRGCSGLNLMKSIEAESSTDANTLMLQMLNSVMTLIMKSIPSAPTANSCNQHPSSPLLPIEDELDVCLEVFCKEKGIALDVMAIAMAGFCEVSYNPNAICEAMPKRLQEVSSLAEGQALMLKRFVCGWCDKVDTKRVKQRV